MTAATDKQIAFVKTLAEKALANETPRLSTGQNDAKRHFANTALILALPMPATVAEASEQIDALKGSIISYAQAHRPWAEGVLAQVGAALGSAAVQTSNDGWELTVDQWVAYVREALGQVVA